MVGNLSLRLKIAQVCMSWLMLLNFNVVEFQGWGYLFEWPIPFLHE